MCGSTDQQQTLQTEQMDAYKQAQELTAKQYANQQAIFKPMADQFSAIFALGPSQEGFSQAETDTLNAQAVEGTAENYSQAAKAVNESMAAEGGGSADVTVGGQQQLKSQVAESAAQNQSQQLTHIKEADYEQGYRQWLNAGQGLEAIAAGEDPLGYQRGATESGGAASSTANQIASQNNSWINAALGAAGAIGQGIMTGGTKAWA